MEKLFIVIPSYNEEKSILKVIQELKKFGFQNIVVVDDGSIDNTFKILEKEDIFLLRHIINRGQGAALKTGIDFSLRKGAQYIVTFDADGQHDSKDIKKLVQPIIDKKCEVTLGSRFINKKVKIPFTRKLILKAGIIIQWIFYGILLSDAHNGLRCFSRKAASKIKIKSNGMEHASEIIEEIKKNRLKYMEVPVNIRYTEYAMKKGHGGLFQAMKVFFKMVMHKITK